MNDNQSGIWVIGFLMISISIHSFDTGDSSAGYALWRFLFHLGIDTPITPFTADMKFGDSLILPQSLETVSGSVKETWELSRFPTSSIKVPLLLFYEAPSHEAHKKYLCLSLSKELGTRIDSFRLSGGKSWDTCP